MEDVSQLPLSDVDINGFKHSLLYCLGKTADNPLQDPAVVPGCYGICPNPDLSGLGLRSAIYAQTLIATTSVLWSDPQQFSIIAIISNFSITASVVASAVSSFITDGLSFHHIIVAVHLLCIANVQYLACMLNIRQGVRARFLTFVIGFMVFLQGIGLVILVGFGGNIATKINDIPGFEDMPGAGSLVGAINVATSWVNLRQAACLPETKLSLWVLEIFPFSSPSHDKSSLGWIIGTFVIYAAILFAPLILGLIIIPFFFNKPKRGMPRKPKPLTVFWALIVNLLAAGWIATVAVNTELQIRRNKVLEGESEWKYSQILPVLLTVVPLFTFINLLINKFFPNSKGARFFERAQSLGQVHLPASQPPSPTSGHPYQPPTSENKDGMGPHYPLGSSSQMDVAGPQSHDLESAPLMSARTVSVVGSSMHGGRDRSGTSSSSGSAPRASLGGRDRSFSGEGSRRDRSGTVTSSGSSARPGSAMGLAR